jgi:hypothetical protein
MVNVSVLDSMVRVDSFPVRLEHNATWERQVNFTVPDASYNRIDFLLFNETVPGLEVTGTDRINASYRNLHLWFNATA